MGTFQRSQLDTIVDALGLQRRFRLAYLDVKAFGDRHSQHIGQIVLPLGIAVGQA